MDFLIISVIGIFIVLMITALIYLFLSLSATNEFVSSLAALTERTFREFYKHEELEPVMIGNGLDILWKGDVKGLKKENNRGFITILTNDGGVNSPINSYDEADIIAGKISHVVYEYIKERDGKI